MEKLGIQPSILITQVINFAILAVLLWKFLYKPVTKMLDARKSQIEQDLKSSQSLKEQQAELEKEKQKVIKQAHLEAAEILNKAKKSAKSLKDTELESANQEISKERAKLIKEMDSRLAKERQTLQDNVLTLASALTRKVLTDSLSKEDQAKIIDASLAKLTKTHAK